MNRSKSIEMNINSTTDKENLVYLKYVKIKSEILYIQYIGKISSMIGISLSLFGLIYFILDTFGIDLTEKQSLGILLFFGGAYFTYLINVYVSLKKIKLKYNETGNISHSGVEILISSWNNFENICKNVLSTKNGINPFSIREMIKGLYDKKYITQDELNILIDYLRMRNSMLHNNISIPYKEIVKSSLFLEDIGKKITNEFLMN